MVRWNGSDAGRPLPLACHRGGREGRSWHSQQVPRPQNAAKPFLSFLSWVLFWMWHCCVVEISPRDLTGTFGPSPWNQQRPGIRLVVTSGCHRYGALECTRCSLSHFSWLCHPAMFILRARHFGVLSHQGRVIASSKVLSWTSKYHVTVAPT